MGSLQHASCLVCLIIACWQLVQTAPKTCAEGAGGGGDSVCAQPKDHRKSKKSTARIKLQDLPSPEGLEWHLLSEDPYILAMDNFLSSAEAEEMIRLGSDGRLVRSLVQTQQDYGTEADADWSSVRSGKMGVVNDTEEEEVPLVHHILKRIHRFTHFPLEYSEHLSVSHYNVSEKFELHSDSTGDGSDNRLKRLATMLVYLNDVEAGGETVFSKTYMSCDLGMHMGSDGRKRDGIRNCCELDLPGILKVPARRGRAVFFFSHDYFSNVLKENVRHAGCPVQKGEKWILQRWLHRHPFRNAYSMKPDARFEGLPRSIPQPIPDRHDLRILSQKEPRAFLIDGVLNETECKHLLDLARRRLAKQNKKARPPKAGIEKVTLTRKHEVNDRIVSKIVKRMHRLAHVPEAHGESLQLVRYPAGYGQQIHFDSSAENTRPLSLFVYLSGDGANVVDGASFFPRKQCKDLATCCQLASTLLKKKKSNSKVIAVPALAGRAVLFGSHTLESPPDWMAQHGMCPANKGDIWIVERLFQMKPTSSPKFRKDDAFDGIGSLEA